MAAGRLFDVSGDESGQAQAGPAVGEYVEPEF
jgi:hypothetical protein